MPFLERALDPREVTRRADLSRLGPGRWRFETAAIVRHKPGRRCLVEYRAANGEGAALTLLGKMRARGTDRGTYELQRRLWEGDFGPAAPDGIELPEPIAIVPELGLWLQHKVSGISLTDLLTPEVNFAIKPGLWSQGSMFRFPAWRPRDPDRARTFRRFVGIGRSAS